MSYNYLINRISEDAVAGVTANDGNTTIDYLPDGFVSAKDWFKRKSQLKKKWKLEVADDKVTGNYHVKVGEDTIRVPKQYYQHFNEKVINVIGKDELDCTCLFEEAQNEEVAELHAAIEKQIKGNLLLQKAVTQTIIIRNYWLNTFPNHVDMQLAKNTLIDLNNYAESTVALINTIKQTYGSDVGALELLLKALENGDQLDQNEPFLNYQNLLGCKIKSNHLGVVLTLELNVGMTLIPNQSIEIQSDNAEEIASELSRYSAKANGTKVYPSGWIFVPNVFTGLKNEIKELA